jgi:YVTN family beta-propeller protein
MNPFTLAFTPDGTRAYVTNFGENTVSIVNTVTNRELSGRIRVGAFPSVIIIARVPIR